MLIMYLKGFYTGPYSDCIVPAGGFDGFFSMY